MKNLGKIGLVAGLAAALIVVLRKRKDGTRMLDDITCQVAKWANMLTQAKEKLSMADGNSAHQSAPRTSPKTSTSVSSGRNPGDIQE